MIGSRLPEKVICSLIEATLPSRAANGIEGSVVSVGGIHLSLVGL